MPQPTKGTFAELYDTEQRVRTSRPGRPKAKVKRKQVTLYLTPEQEEALSDLHHAWKKHIKVDRSDLAGLAIELLDKVAAERDGLLDFRNFESLKVQLLERT
jgi:hypothetical protein